MVHIMYVHVCMYVAIRIGSNSKQQIDSLTLIKVNLDTTKLIELASYKKKYVGLAS